MSNNTKETPISKIRNLLSPVYNYFPLKEMVEEHPELRHLLEDSEKAAKESLKNLKVFLDSL